MTVIELPDQLAAALRAKAAAQGLTLEAWLKTSPMRKHFQARHAPRRKRRLEFSNCNSP